MITSKSLYLTYLLCHLSNSRKRREKNLHIKYNEYINVDEVENETRHLDQLCVRMHLLHLELFTILWCISKRPPEHLNAIRKVRDELQLRLNFNKK